MGGNDPIPYASFQVPRLDLRPLSGRGRRMLRRCVLRDPCRSPFAVDSRREALSNSSWLILHARPRPCAWKEGPAIRLLLSRLIVLRNREFFSLRLMAVLEDRIPSDQGSAP